MTPRPHPDTTRFTPWDGPTYDTPETCLAPGCDMPAAHKHHAWRRSYTVGGVDWMHDQKLNRPIPNLVALCFSHHNDVEDDRARIDYDEDFHCYVWVERQKWGGDASRTPVDWDFPDPLRSDHCDADKGDRSAMVTSERGGPPVPETNPVGGARRSHPPRSTPSPLIRSSSPGSPARTDGINPAGDPSSHRSTVRTADCRSADAGSIPAGSVTPALTEPDVPLSYAAQSGPDAHPVGRTAAEVLTREAASGSVKAGEKCELCKRRVPHERKPTTPTTKPVSYRVPTDEWEAHKNVLDAAAEYVGVAEQPYSQFKVVALALAHLLQDETVKDFGKRAA